MVIAETMLLAGRCIYLVNLNADIENTVRIVLHVLNCTRYPKDRIIDPEICDKLWKVIGAEMFSLYSKHYLYIVDYHSKFPVIKKTEDNFFSEYRLPPKIISDAGGNFVSGKS